MHITATQKKQLFILLAILVGTVATILMVKTVQDLRSKAFNANKAFYMTDENGNALQQTGNDEQNNVFKYRRTSNTVRMNIQDLNQ
jgi:hypothetical protein